MNCLVDNAGNKGNPYFKPPMPMVERTGYNKSSGWTENDKVFISKFLRRLRNMQTCRTEQVINEGSLR